MKDFYIKSLLAICFLFLMIMVGCEEESTEPAEVPTPEVTSLDPEAGLAGESATITGKNFNPDPSKNLIRFGYDSNFGYKSIRADDATETTLEFTRPLISAVGVDINTKVRVRRIDDPAQELSNLLDITFKPLISYLVEDLGHTRGITFDADGNAYVCTVEPDEVWKITPAGEKTVYAEVGGRGAIVFDSDGYLYIGQKFEETIVRVVPGGGDSEVFTTLPGGPVSLDFATNGNLYVGLADAADGKALWMVTPEGEATNLDIGGESWFLSLRICDNNVYWYDRETASLNKAPVTADGIGTPELLWESDDPDYFATGLSVDSEGAVYLGGGWDHFTLDRVNTDGSFESLFTLPTDNLKFSAFFGKDLYVTSQLEGLVYKIYVGVEGCAP